MKKVLFATTALVATASVAAADINLSGGGRFGLVYNSQSVNGVKNTFSKVRMERRMTINIDGSGSTDGGLEFGGRMRLRSDEGDGSSAVASSNAFLGNDSFRITVGNTNGALLQRVGYFQGTIGLTGLHWANLSFNIGESSWSLNSYSSRGNTGDVVRLDFNAGGLGLSVSTDTTGTYNASGTPTEDAIAVSYNFGDWTVAAGYAANAVIAAAGDGSITAGTAVVGEGLDLMSLSVVGSIGDIGVGLGYTDKEKIGSKLTLSGSYGFGDTTLTAFVANTSEDIAGTAGISATQGSDTEYGFGFSHNLGGATLAGGVSKNYQKNTQADLGVSFSF